MDVASLLSASALYRVHAGGLGNPPWESAGTRVLIARLSPFRDVERSTPHYILFEEARAALPSAYLDFAFLPASRDRAVLSERGLPWMHGLASRRGAGEFDVVLISNSYTLELVNLLPMLSASGIEPRAIRRARSTVHTPVIVLGGSNAMAAGAVSGVRDPDGHGALVDALFFGEGEGRIGPLVTALADIARLPPPGRSAAMQSLAGSMEGFWPTARMAARDRADGAAPAVAGATSGGASPEIAWSGVASRDASPGAASGPASQEIPAGPDSVQISAGPLVQQARAAPGVWPRLPATVLAGAEAGTARIEITKGCPSFCNFCFEGWERKPFRERPFDDIIAEARRVRSQTGADRVELASYNFNTHSRIVDIILALQAMFADAGFQSQRIDILARSPGLVRFEVAAGKRSFTLGVEGLSARMRTYYNKELPDDDIRTVLSALVEHGARELKLFYILSGFEDDADCGEFEGFCVWLDGLLQSRPPGRRPRVIVSTGELVRMPFTPLAWEDLVLDESVYRGIGLKVSTSCKVHGFEYRTPAHFDEYLLTQILAACPTDVSSLVDDLAEQGVVYDGSLSRNARGITGRWLAGSALSTSAGPDGHGAIPELVSPVASRVLSRQRYEAARAALTGQTVDRAGCLGRQCVGCGACDEPERAATEAHRLDGATTADCTAAEAILAAKRKPHRTALAVEVPENQAGADPAYVLTTLRARLYRSAAVCGLQGVLDSVFSSEDSLLLSEDGLARLPGAWGDSVMTLLSTSALDRSALARVAAAAGMALVGAEPEPPHRCAVSFRTTDGSLPRTVGKAKTAIERFLSDEALPHTLHVMSDGCYRFVIAAKGIKKHNVLDIALKPDSAGGARAEFLLGPKYNLAALARAAGKLGLEAVPEFRLAATRPAL